MTSSGQGHSGHKAQDQDLGSRLWTPFGVPSHFPRRAVLTGTESEGIPRKEARNVGRSVTAPIHQLPEATWSRQAKLLRVWEVWPESIRQGFLVCFLLPSPWHLRSLFLISLHCLLPGGRQRGPLRNCGFSFSLLQQQQKGKLMPLPRQVVRAHHPLWACGPWGQALPQPWPRLSTAAENL